MITLYLNSSFKRLKFPSLEPRIVLDGAVYDTYESGSESDSTTDDNAEETTTSTDNHSNITSLPVLSASENLHEGAIIAVEDRENLTPLTSPLEDQRLYEAANASAEDRENFTPYASALVDQSSHEGATAGLDSSHASETEAKLSSAENFLRKIIDKFSSMSATAHFNIDQISSLRNYLDSFSYWNWRDLTSLIEEITTLQKNAPIFGQGSRPFDSTVRQENPDCSIQETIDQLSNSATLIDQNLNNLTALMDHLKSAKDFEEIDSIIRQVDALREETREYFKTPVESEQAPSDRALSTSTSDLNSDSPQTSMAMPTDQPNARILASSSEENSPDEVKMDSTEDGIIQENHDEEFFKSSEASGGFSDDYDEGLDELSNSIHTLKNNGIDDHDTPTISSDAHMPQILSSINASEVLNEQDTEEENSKRFDPTYLKDFLKPIPICNSTSPRGFSYYYKINTKHPKTGRSLCYMVPAESPTTRNQTIPDSSEAQQNPDNEGAHSEDTNQSASYFSDPRYVFNEKKE